jgi:hypothetical protein
MPTMASITVKKADGTTDIVYDALAASGGDNSPAAWRQDTGAVAPLPEIGRAWCGERGAGPVCASMVRV